MAEKKKTKSVVASKLTVAEAELNSLVREHGLVGEVLRDHESLTRIAKARNSKLDKASLLEEVVTREKELSSQISELRKTVKPRPQRQIMDFRGGLPGPGGFPSDEDLWWLRFWATVLGDPWRPPTGWRPPIPDPECVTVEGLSVADPVMSCSEITTPQVADASQVVTHVTDTSGEWIIFEDCFIDLTASQNFFSDYFWEACRLDFAFPPAECDGTLTYWLRGQIAGGPVIESGPSGFVGAWARSMLHIDGDANDPDDYFSYALRGWVVSQPGTVLQWGPIDHSASIDLKKGERALLHVAAILTCQITGGQDWGGRASFADGTAPVGHVVVTTPLGALQPGVRYQIVPTSP